MVNRSGSVSTRAVAAAVCPQAIVPQTRHKPDAKDKLASLMAHLSGDRMDLIPRKRTRTLDRNFTWRI